MIGGVSVTVRLGRVLRATADLDAMTDQRTHLEDKGILTKVCGNHRNRKWAAGEVLHALDDFAERAGRRSRPA